jgi:hypothetical protein
MSPSNDDDDDDDDDTTGVLTINTTSQDSFVVLASVIEPLDLLVSSVLLGCVFALETPQDSALRAVRRSLRDATRSSQLAGRRFLPEFARIEGGDVLSQLSDDDPLNKGVLVGMGAWARIELQRADASLYEKIYGAVRVTKIQQNSPLLLSVAVAIGASATTFGAIVAACFRVAAREHEREQARKLRELEIADRQEALEQQRLRTEVLREVSRAVARRGDALQVPDEFLTEVAKVAHVPIREIAKSPFINSVNFSVQNKQEGA